MFNVTKCQHFPRVSLVFIQVFLYRTSICQVVKQRPLWKVRTVLRHIGHTHPPTHTSCTSLFIIINRFLAVCVSVCLFIAFGYKARVPTSYSSYLFVYFCGGLFVNEEPGIPFILMIPQPCSETRCRTVGNAWAGSRGGG